MKLPTFPHDKLSHYFYGTAIALAMLPFFSPYSIMCSLLGISVVKEIQDGYRGGVVDYKDLLATIAGGAVIILARVI